MMLLPTKRLSPRRSLIVVGAEVLETLSEPKTVSRVWDELGQKRGSDLTNQITFEWFVLSLDVLYAVRAIDLVGGRLVKAGAG